MTKRAPWQDIEDLRLEIASRPIDFDELLRRWPVGGIVDLVHSRHVESPRCYHDIRHIRENWRIVLDEGHFDRFAGRQVDLFATNVFHDIVYVPGSSGNEAESADEFLSLHPTEGEGGEWSRTVRDVILATRDHLDPANEALPDWGRLFLDVDLFHLASDPETYAESGRRLTEEFSSILTLDQIMTGRVKWLESMLSRPRIYWIMTEREEGARRNLQADWKMLTARGFGAASS